MSNSNTSLEALKMHLFEALEGVKNLSDPEASECEKVSLEQAKQIVNIAEAIIDINKTQINAMQVFSEMDDVASVDVLMEGTGVTENLKRLQ